MKIKGTVTETIIFTKEVEIEVASDADEDEIYEAIRDKALIWGIPDGINDWHMERSEGIEVAVKEKSE